MENKEKTSMNPTVQKKSFFDAFKSRAFRAGGYSTLAALLVVVIAAAAVFGVESLPTTLTKFDTTEAKLFSLSDQSKKIAAAITEETTIYLVAQPSNEDATLSALLDRYTAVNPKIKVKHIDPVVSPNFFSKYTKDTLYENSLVIVSGERSKCVSYSDVYESSYENYSVTGEATTVFNGEGRVTSAIDYVVSGNLPVVYRLTGHGEAYPPASVQTAISSDNIELQELTLVNADAVPESGEAILIYSPKTDLSASETEVLLSYLDQGGKVLLVTDYQDTALPNLMTVAAHYGLSLAEGIVMEADLNHLFRNYNYYLLPTVNSHTITTPLRIGGYSVLIPLAQGIVIGDAPRDTVKVTSLLDTTDQSYSKPAGYGITTFEREDGDISGPFSVGVAVTEDVSNGKQAQLVWLTSTELLADEMNSLVSGANQDLFLNALNWMCEREDSIAVRAKSVGVEQLTVPTSDATRWSLILVIGLPLLIIAVGVYIIVSRKRK